jgi:cellulose synthase operon protein C
MKTSLYTAILPAIFLLSACGSDGANGDAGSYQKALKQFESGQFAAANVELMNAAKSMPGDASVYILRARVFLKLGDGVAAEGQVAQARDLNGDAKILATLATEAALLQKDTVKAARLIDAAGGAFESPGDQERLTGERMMLDREFGGAIRQFEAARAISPNDGRVAIGLGHVQLLTGDYAGAEQSATTAIELNPRWSGAHILAARTALFQQQYPAALSHFDKAAALDKNNVAAIFGKASVYGEMGNMAEMQNWTDRGRKLEPADPFGMFLLARLAANKNDYKRAYGLMEQTGDGLAEDAVASTFAGEMAIKMGYTAKAINHFERAIAVAPEITHLYVLLAHAQLVNKEPAAALATLRKFDAFTPLPEEVVELRAKIGAMGAV